MIFYIKANSEGRNFLIKKYGELKDESDHLFCDYYKINISEKYYEAISFNFDINFKKLIYFDELISYINVVERNDIINKILNEK